MLESYNIENILFLDIETVSNSRNYYELPERMKGLWDKKAENLARNDKSLTEEEKASEALYSRAGIYAEFGKIICISTGIVRGGLFKMKSYFGHDEKELLTDFANMLRKSGGRSFQFLCAHNGKEFDFPYMIRRMLINGVDVPPILDLAGKKPWEVNHLDTMELWKFGDFKNYTSLELLAAVFDIPTPKDDIHGADVGRVYWEDGNLERIVTYCRKDVITIVNLFLRFQLKPMIHDNEISFVES